MATTPVHDEEHDEPAPPSGGTLVEYEAYIDAQLRKTRGNVRSVDIVTNVLALLSGVLLYFFFAALIDHWVISGGLGFWGRLILLVGCVGTSLYFFVWRILPLVVRRINPVYAAETIERSQPEMKNTLVNLLMFRASSHRLPQRVYEAIEEQAATRLAQVPVDGAVDRGKLIRIGYVLAGVVLLCALYTLLSPKNPFQTARRVVMPWAELEAPTRTTIHEIEPGTAQVFRGQQAVVRARIDGLPVHSPVALVYSTADGQVVDRRVEMKLPPDAYRYEGVLPAENGLLQQSLTYHIEAGDATTPRFRLEVVAAPAILVRQVIYKYPAYTGLVEQRVANQGDLKGIEGTQVTLQAAANEEIQSANLDFECDGKHDLRMQPSADGLSAEVTFRLRLAEDRRAAEHGLYQLLFKNRAGLINPQPVRHQIEVTRDQAPTIEFVYPSVEEIDVPADATLELELAAGDPDFALRRVQLDLRSGGRPLGKEVILLDEPWRGQWVKKHRLRPDTLGLKAGDLVEVSATATDNKDPDPNQATTAVRRIRIVPPSAAPRKPSELAQRDKPGLDGRDGPQTGRGGADTEHPQTEPRPEDGAPGENVATQPGPGDAPLAAQDPQGDLKVADPEQPDSKSGDETPSVAQRDGQQNRSKAQEKSADNSGEQGGGGSAGGGDSQKGSQGDSGDSQNQADNQPSGASPSGGDKSGDGNRAIPSDGSDDGEAIEEILKHREQQAKKQQQGDSEGQGQKTQKPGENPKSAGQKPEKNDSQSKASQAPGDEGQAPGTKSNKQPAKKPSDSDQQAEQEKQPGEDQPSEDGKKPGKPTGADKQSSSEGSPDAEQPQNESGGAQDKQSGSGKQPQDKQGAGKPEKPGGQGAKGDDAESGGGGAGQGNQKGTGKGKQGPPQDQGGKGGDAAASEAEGEGGKARADKGKPGDKPGASGEQGGGKGKPTKPNGKSSPPGQEGDTPGDDTQTPAEQGEASESQSPGNAAQGAPPNAQKGSYRKPSSDEDAADATKSDDAPPPDAESRPAQDQDAPDEDAHPKPSSGSTDKPQGKASQSQKGAESKASPDPLGNNKPREKSPDESPDAGQAPPEDAGQSPSTSDHESKSKGAQDGDRSGGGKQGGGQKGNKRGQGAQGESTAADEGAGQAEEAGDGETSGRAGDDKPAQRPTGQSGASQGQGSAGRPGGEGGPKGSGSAPPDSAGVSSDDGLPSGEGDEEATGEAAGLPSGGQPGAENSPGKGSASSGPTADAANLDYARKATDLALEHLKDELNKEQPDPALLKKLGWTRDELENFVRRWEAMRRQAQIPGEGGAEARRELDETLSSLGLKPRATKMQGNAGRGDRSQGYRQSRQVAPPAEYSDAYKAYLQGTARGNKAGAPPAKGGSR